MLLTVVLALAVLAALGGWYFGFARYTTTPGVLNLSQAAAGAKLDRNGLEMEVSDTAYSETVRKGFVISTSPGPGDRVREDGTVEAVISLGPERHKVPDVRGETLDDAQQALDEARPGVRRRRQPLPREDAQGPGDRHRPRRRHPAAPAPAPWT